MAVKNQPKEEIKEDETLISHGVIDKYKEAGKVANS